MGNINKIFRAGESNSLIGAYRRQYRRPVYTLISMGNGKAAFGRNCDYLDPAAYVNISKRKDLATYETKDILSDQVNMALRELLVNSAQGTTWQLIEQDVAETIRAKEPHSQCGYLVQGDGNPSAIHLSSPDSEITLSEDREIQNIPCLGNTKVVFFDNGNLHIATLARRADLQGIPCRENTLVKLDRDGKIQMATLSGEYRHDQLVLKAGAQVRFDEDGSVEEATLAEDQYVQGAGWGEYFMAGARVNFRKSRPGMIASVKLAIDQKIQEIPCLGGTWVYFHENGRLKNLTLSEAIWLKSLADEEIQFIKGDKVRFYPNGRVFRPTS